MLLHHIFKSSKTAALPTAAKMQGIQINKESCSRYGKCDIFESGIINPSMNFQDISTIEDLQRASGEAIWQNFERLVAFIFEVNDFQVVINKIKTFKRKRRQYDVIARKNERIFLVECKKWAGNRYRSSALKKAIVQHKERTEFYENLTGEATTPILVTLIEEDIKFYEDLPIVPIFKLNSFINEIDRDSIRTSNLL